MSINRRSPANLLVKPKNLDKIICPICNLILISPISCQNCKKNFCSACIALYVHKNKKCVCNEKYKSLNCEENIKKMLDTLVFICQNQFCGIYVKYGDLENHSKECKKISTSVSNIAENTNKSIKISENTLLNEDEQFLHEINFDKSEPKPVLLEKIEKNSREKINFDKEILPELLFVLSKCINCQKMTLTTCSKKCFSCNSTLCNQCITECKKCNSIYCNLCLKNQNADQKLKCVKCEQNICKNCVNKCEKCKANFCKDCIGNCIECNKKYCENCITNGYFIKCENCKNLYCSTCILECMKCKISICSKCVKKCLGCNNKFCSKCSEKCIKCDWSLVPENPYLVYADNNLTVSVKNKFGDEYFMLRGTAEFKTGVHKFSVAPYEIQKDCSGYGLGIAKLSDFLKYERESENAKKNGEYLEISNILLGITPISNENQIKPHEIYTITVDLDKLFVKIEGKNCEFESRLEKNEIYIPIFTRCHGKFKISVKPMPLFI